MIEEEDSFPSHSTCSDTEDVGVSSVSSQFSNEDMTYFSLLEKNRSFRLYMLSYLISQVGE